MKVGIIAGYGELPIISAKNLKANGDIVIAFIIKESCNRKEEITQITDKYYEFSAGEVGKILKTFKKEKLTDVFLIGKVEISLLESGVKLDLKALFMLAKLHFRSTDTISLAIVNEFRKIGVNILSQREVLSNCLYGEGVFSKLQPTSQIIADVKRGFEAAKAIGAIDLGQSIVIKDSVLTAIESAEGTDITFARGCLEAESDAVAVKVAKPSQDERFDLPTVGVDTLKSIAFNGGKVLAIEANETIVVNMEACVQFADKYGLIFMSVKG